MLKQPILITDLIIIRCHARMHSVISNCSYLREYLRTEISVVTVR